MVRGSFKWIVMQIMNIKEQPSLIPPPTIIRIEYVIFGVFRNTVWPIDEIALDLSSP